MQDNPNKTEQDTKQEKAFAIQAIKFAQVETGSVLYWHFLGLASQGMSEHTNRS